ncbi:unnamed protein product [Clonostachys byssicola]|uniref:Uncharacterized protein n=1 Tax=Clonostachys byssicola TaxID=160290 RepID=A0A9N9U064_9HYPO|nr:unnamed protein product [Clonostachys byssicola]
MASNVNIQRSGTLYITISIPPLLAYQRPSTLPYPSHLPPDFDVTNYELQCAHGFRNEEFSWGLYFDHGQGSGTWYTLRRVWPRGIDPTMPIPPAFQLIKQDIPIGILRLNAKVVGLIRVFAEVPGANTDAQTGGLRYYLDWLTANLAIQATRSFLWAVGVYVRCRQHVVRAHGLSDSGTFDISRFLKEALTFAYQEVWYAIGGQLPRPIITSVLGAALVRDEFLDGNRTQEVLPSVEKDDEKVLDVTDESQWPKLPERAKKTK